MMNLGSVLSLETIALWQSRHIIVDPRIKSEGDVRDLDPSEDKSYYATNL